MKIEIENNLKHQDKIIKKGWVGGSFCRPFPKKNFPEKTRDRRDRYFVLFFHINSAPFSLPYTATGNILYLMN